VLETLGHEILKSQTLRENTDVERHKSKDRQMDHREHCQPSPILFTFATRGNLRVEFLAAVHLHRKRIRRSALRERFIETAKLLMNDRDMCVRACVYIRYFVCGRVITTPHVSVVNVNKHNNSRKHVHVCTAACDGYHKNEHTRLDHEEDCGACCFQGLMRTYYYFKQTTCPLSRPRPQAGPVDIYHM